MSEPLRVALFGNFLSATNGGRSICEDLAVLLADRGAKVVSASTRPQPLRRLLDMLTTAVRERRRYDIAYIDVYSGRGFIWAESVAMLLRLLRKPYALVLRGGSLPEFARRNSARVSRLLRGARRVVAPSPFLAGQMRGFRQDILVLPNAVDIGAYRGGRARDRAAPRFVWLRSFHSNYNVEMAARVLAGVSASQPEARLTMAGPDKGDGSREAFIAEATRLSVIDRVDLVGNVPKSGIPALLDRHDIFLNTARVDNMPVSVIEAMAAGLCIVSTNVGGIPEFCRHDETALLVDSGDAQAMTAACLSLIEDPSRARRLSAAALREAGQYDRDLMIVRWEELLASAAGAS